MLFEYDWMPNISFLIKQKDLMEHIWTIWNISINCIWHLGNIQWEYLNSLRFFNERYLRDNQWEYLNNSRTFNERYLRNSNGAHMNNLRSFDESEKLCQVAIARAWCRPIFPFSIFNFCSILHIFSILYLSRIFFFFSKLQYIFVSQYSAKSLSGLF